MFANLGVSLLPLWPWDSRRALPVWNLGLAWWGRHETRDSSRACRTFCYRTTMGLEVEDARVNLPEEATSNLKLTG